MKLVNAAIIGVGAFLVVKYLRDDKVGIPSLPGDSGPGGTVPLPGAGTVVPGSPGAGVGVVPGDPGVIPGQNSGSIGQPCAGCGGPTPSPSTSGVYGGGKFLTAPPPRPPPRDHRTYAPDGGGGFTKPRLPGAAGGKTGGKTTAPITCVRAPCPTTPKSGMTSPHHQSRTIQFALAHSPVVY